jgi:hypothetical protein
MGMWFSGRAIQWDTTHNSGDRTFFEIFLKLQGTCTRARSEYRAFPAH